MNAGTQFVLGVSLSNAIIAVDGSGNVWRSDIGGEGWRQVAAGACTNIAGASVLFADSRGYLFYGSSSNTTLLRSTDGGTTWGTSLTLPGVTDSASPMCEDDQGNLYIGAYGSATTAQSIVSFTGASGTPVVGQTLTKGVTTSTIAAVYMSSGTAGKLLVGAITNAPYTAGAGTAGAVTLTVSGAEVAFGTGQGTEFNSRTVWKSVDGGANWTDITTLAQAGGLVQRHIHGVWWDPYRKNLYLSRGDAGATSDIYVSGDYSATTWSAWTASVQCTSMAFSTDYVFFAGDQITFRGVMRAPQGTAAQVAASTPTRVFDWVVDGGQSSSGGSSGTGNGFAWQAYFDGSVVCFPYGSEGARWAIIATADNGATWYELWSGANANTRVFHEQCEASRYMTGRDGFLYGRNSVDNTFWQWRCYAPGAVVSVNPSATSRGDGVLTARNDFIHYGIRSAGVIQSLAANHNSGPIIAPGANTVILTKGFQLGAAGNNAVVFENVDSVTPPTLPTGTIVATGATAGGLTLSTGGTGSAVVSSATQAYSGANSLKAAVTAGTGNSQFRLTTPSNAWTLADGSEAWVSCRVYWNGTIDANRQDIFECDSIRVGVQLANTVKCIRVFNSTLSLNLNSQQAGDQITIPENTWFRLKAAIVKAPNTTPLRNGRVRVWVDVGSGWRLVCDARGVATYSALSQNWFIGINQGASGAAANAYFDDIRWGTSDPDRLPAVTLAQNPSSVPDLGLFV